MALRKIVTLPEPVLRRKARAVNKFDKGLQTVIDDMIETMREAPGVGLAAPQLGEPRGRPPVAAHPGARPPRPSAHWLGSDSPERDAA